MSSCIHHSHIFTHQLSFFLCIHYIDTWTYHVSEATYKGSFRHQAGFCKLHYCSPSWFSTLVQRHTWLYCCWIIMSYRPTHCTTQNYISTVICREYHKKMKWLQCLMVLPINQNTVWSFLHVQTQSDVYCVNSCSIKLIGFVYVKHLQMTQL